MNKQIAVAFLFVSAFVIFTVTKAVRCQEAAQRTSAVKSMATLMDEIVKAKQMKDVRFLEEAGQVLPTSFVWGPNCVMSYYLYPGYKDEDHGWYDRRSPKSAHDCIRVWISAYRNIEDARLRSDCIGTTNCIIAEYGLSLEKR